MRVRRYRGRCRGRKAANWWLDVSIDGKRHQLSLRTAEQGPAMSAAARAIREPRANVPQGRAPFRCHPLRSLGEAERGGRAALEAGRGVVAPRPG